MAWLTQTVSIELFWICPKTKSRINENPDGIDTIGIFSICKERTDLYELFPEKISQETFSSTLPPHLA